MVNKKDKNIFIGSSILLMGFIIIVALCAWFVAPHISPESFEGGSPILLIICAPATIDNLILIFIQIILAGFNKNIPTGIVIYNAASYCIKTMIFSVFFSNITFLMIGINLLSIFLIILNVIFFARIQSKVNTQK